MQFMMQQMEGCCRGVDLTKVAGQSDTHRHTHRYKEVIFPPFLPARKSYSWFPAFAQSVGLEPKALREVSLLQTHRKYSLISKNDALSSRGR